MRNEVVVVWDLGATKCAFGVVVGNPKTKELRVIHHDSILLKSVNSLPELVGAIEANLQIKHCDVSAICIGAAGIYDGSSLKLAKGYPYAMTIKAIAHEQKWPNTAVIHDYALIMCATFCKEIAMKTISEGEGECYGRRVAFGIGTGLGLKDGVLFKNDQFWLGTNEMGHLGIPEVIGKKHLKLVTFEEILSGSGMLRLHRFLNPRSQVNSPQELGELIRLGQAPDTLALFAFYVGLFTATVQLAFMPSGGIFMAGGVLLKHLSVFDCPEYLQGISALSAYETERKKFPLKVLIDEKTPFLGGAFYALNRLLAS